MQIIVYIIFAICVLLLAAMWPGRGRRERMLFFGRKPVAHRGFHDNAGPAPENSMAAYRLAVEKGYGIELDVRSTADGQLICMHDRNLKRATGIDASVDEMNWSDLRKLKLFGSGEKIPRFRDVLSCVDGRVPIIMEIKGESIDAVKRTSEEAAYLLDSYEGPVCMESFHPYAVWWFLKNRPETLRGQLSERFRDLKGHEKPLCFFLSFCIFNFLTRPDFIAYNVKHRGLFRFRIQRDFFHSVCAAWTVRSEEELRAAALDFDIFIFEGFEPPVFGAVSDESDKSKREGNGASGRMRQVVRRYYLVSGTVQAVGFRYRSVNIAQSLGITGFVRNRNDERVEMELQGTEAELKEMFRRLGEQRYIRITGVEERELEVIPGEYEFKVRY